MGHWSSGKYSTDYEDKDNEEVNQSTSSPEREEYPLLAEEPVEDDGEPTYDEEEVAPATSKEEEKEAPTEEVDNIT